MMDVTLLGCGGMMPLPDRFLTSCMIQVNGHSILIDCGESTQTAIRCAGLSFKPIDMICITHFHADHIAGLVGVLLSMANSERTDPVTIVTPPKGAQILPHLLVVAPKLPFDLYVSELRSGINHITGPDLDITTFELKHRVPCWGYSFYLPRGAKFDPEAAQDLQIPRMFWSLLQKGESVTLEDGRTIEPEQVTGPARTGLRVTYATDTRPVAAISDVGKNSDLMILEGMYGNDEKLEKAKYDGHMTFEEAARLAFNAHARELWLTHYSPSLPDPETYLDNACAIFPNTHCGYSGKQVTLRFAD